MLLTQRIAQINVKFKCISIIGYVLVELSTNNHYFYKTIRIASDIDLIYASDKHNTSHRNIDVPATVTLFIIHTDKTEIDYFPLLKATRL